MKMTTLFLGLLLALGSASALDVELSSRPIRRGAFFQQGADAPRGTHENVFVEVRGKFVSMLGRRGPSTAIYDMQANTWEELPARDFGAEVHHCQGVEWKGSVVIGGCLKGNFPVEEPLTDIYRFFPNTNVWEKIGSFPADRDRGSTGLVVRRGKFYFINGGRGHRQGVETTTNMFDEFNPRKNTWTTLPDTPRVRDHGGAVYYPGTDEIFVGGGRWGGQFKFFQEQFAYKQVDVYSFSTGSWSTLTEEFQVGHPGNTPARSSRFFVLCGGEVEKDTTDPALCEFLDMKRKIFVRKTIGVVTAERHGTGMATCSSNKNIICTANGARREPGANIDLVQSECLLTDGVAAVCEPDQSYWS